MKIKVVRYWKWLRLYSLVLVMLCILSIAGYFMRVISPSDFLSLAPWLLLLLIGPWRLGKIVFAKAGRAPSPPEMPQTEVYLDASFFKLALLDLLPLLLSFIVALILQALGYGWAWLLIFVGAVLSLPWRGN